MTNGDATITITPEEFQYFWKRVKERTSSSLSGIHYGHYKAAANSDRISGFLAKKITLISRTGCPPERWSYGLTVMLEKIAGLALVSKLRAILLMEADFNMHNKLIFGKRMLDRARAEGIIPQEQYSDKEHTAEDGTFDKVLQSDISRQNEFHCVSYRLMQQTATTESTMQSWRSCSWQWVCILVQLWQCCAPSS